MKDTLFSPCRRYRYTLWRTWDVDLFDTNPNKDHYLMVIGLNPSTADETEDDPTIRRCIDYAKRWGYSALCMTNLFGWRDTDPKKMLAAQDPVGPENDHHLQTCATSAGLIVAAWGNHGQHRGRAGDVCRLIPNLHCLRRNGDGSPAHPLYLPALLTPVPYGLPG